MTTSKKIIILITLISALDIILIIMLAEDVNKQYTKFTNQIYDIGIMDEYGYVGVKLKYSNEPVKITLITPSGKEISKRDVDIYEIDTVNKIITVMADTKELGSWKIKFNQGINRSIRYEFIKTRSKRIHIEKLMITFIHDEPYVIFTPIMSTENTKKCQYSMIIKNEKHAFILNSGEIDLNKKACIKIEPDENAFNNENYQLTLTVTSLDKDLPSSDTKQIDVILPEKTQVSQNTISENNITEE